jgi:hypothetical protein
MSSPFTGQKGPQCQPDQADAPDEGTQLDRSISRLSHPKPADTPTYPVSTVLNSATG